MKPILKKLLACLMTISLLISAAVFSAGSVSAEEAGTDRLTAYPDERIWTTLKDEDCTLQNNNWEYFPNRTFTLNGNNALACGAVWSAANREVAIWFRTNPAVAFSKMTLTVGGKTISASEYTVQTKLNYLTRVFIPLDDLTITNDAGEFSTSLSFTVPYNSVNYSFDGKLIFSETEYTGQAMLIEKASASAFTNAGLVSYRVKTAPFLTEKEVEKYISFDVNVRSLPEVEADQVVLSNKAGDEKAPQIRFYLLSGPVQSGLSAGLHLSLFNVKDQGLVLAYYSAGTTGKLPLNRTVDGTIGTTVTISICWKSDATDFTKDTVTLSYGVNGNNQTTVNWPNAVRPQNVSSTVGFVRVDYLRSDTEQVVSAEFSRIFAAKKNDNPTTDYHEILLSCTADYYANRGLSFQVAEDGKSVRFVSLVKQSSVTELNAVGYGVRAKSGDSESSKEHLCVTRQVWLSIGAAGETVAAPDGFCYVLMTVSGLNLKESTDISFRIRGYVKDTAGNETYTAEYTVTGAQLAAALGE